jgi:hypothetical protein
VIKICAAHIKYMVVVAGFGKPENANKAKYHAAVIRASKITEMASHT